MTRDASLRRWGLLAAGLYLVVAVVSFRAGLFPTRPLYEGFAPPQPYRWVDPPEAVRATNLPALRAEPVTLEVDEAGTLPTTVSTLDQQAQLLLPDGAFEVRTGEEVTVGIEPLAPGELAPAPEGLHFDSNAYRFVATGGDPGEEPQLQAPATVLLRFAYGSGRMFRLEGDRWVEIEATPNQPSLQVFADVDRLGTFVLATEGQPPPGAAEDGTMRDVVAAGIGVAVVIAGIVLSRLRARRANRLPPLKKPPPRVSKRR